jgi:membrane protein DedA with SNARE-associated domain
VNPADWPGGLAYLAIYLAAIIEGEVVFIAATVLVSMGRLNLYGVLTAAALGGASGDQIVFFVLRGRLRPLLARFPTVARRQDAIVARVQRRSAVIILMSRFLPGLRIAIPAACAYAGIPGAKYSTLNLISAIAWASSIMFVVAWLGPNASARLGLSGWWGLLIPAVLVLIFFRWLGAATKDPEKLPGRNKERSSLSQ